MTKKRKTLSDIQAALHSNTQFLGGDTVESEQPVNDSAETLGRITISDQQLADLRLLAEFQNTTIEELVTLALDDLLALRSRYLKLAKGQKE